ncbi:hypothetical protein V1291_000645 [Nitrobacteraceae bacterium AZCC 1564]
MSNRAVVPLFAVLISSLAYTALTVSTVAAPATEDKAETSANECLAAPKAETPKGTHWYYRLEKGTKRKCWYLADAVTKASKAASSAPAPTPSASPAPRRAPESAIQPTVANARAELTRRAPNAENVSDDATLSETIWPEPEPRTDAVASNNDQGTNVQPENTGTGSAATAPAKDWAMTSRWPESNLPNTTDNRSTVPVETRPQQSASLQAATKDKTAGPEAATQFHGIAFNSTPMLLIMLAGVLTIVAVAGRMIIKYASNGRAKNRNPRRNIWDSIPQESGASHAYEALLRPRNSQFADVPAEANDSSDEIEKLLQRASKRAAA